jgi:hypothetical protein
MVPRNDDDLAGHGHRQLIGWSGLSLPFLVYAIAGWRPTKGLTPWELLDSVSDYYYTSSVIVFVGILFALAAFLLTYKGYRDTSIDRVLGIFAGIAALGVSCFPTRAPSRDLAPDWWTDSMQSIHFVSAVGLFGSFIVYSLLLFPKSRAVGGQPRSFEKNIRNAVHRSCGIVMIACLTWAIVARNKDGSSIFWPEAIALVAFAISWLVKGHAGWTVLALAERSIHYPARAGTTAWRMIRGR